LQRIKLTQKVELSLKSLPVPQFCAFAKTLLLIAGAEDYTVEAFSRDIFIPHFAKRGLGV
jgi:hypothetical protein